MKRVLTDAERIVSIREVIEAARGDWHEATALYSVGADLNWLLDKVAARATPSEPTLDAAWKAAEAALPEGWSLSSLTKNSQRGQTVAQAWWASCFGTKRTFGHERRAVGRRMAYGPTPAAALLALAARLGGSPNAD